MTGNSLEPAPADLVLDTSGTCCPMPVVQARAALDRLEIGQTMEVICTDPGSRLDIPAWASNTGQELLTTAHEGDAFRFVVRRTR